IYIYIYIYIYIFIYKQLMMASLPTPTIVRIKRHLGSESSETIIVSSKRIKIDTNDTTPDPVPEICTTILKKLTTLKQGDSFEVETKKALQNEPKHSWELKDSYKKGYQSHSKNLIQKKSKSDVAAIRFKLVCSKRNLQENESDPLGFNIFDALKEKEESPLLSLPSTSTNVRTFKLKILAILMLYLVMVYQWKVKKLNLYMILYYTSLPLELSSWINNICEIQRYNQLDYRDPSSKHDDEYEDDNDDENSESNWRNDYPDEEDTKFYDDEDDFLCDDLMKKANLENTSEDSSFDADNYDDSGDFDEDGNLVTFEKKTESVFDKYKKGKLKLSSDESDSD
ncbi:hypothetical protein Anas_10562, partial [Armadillidium nasatum]